MNNRRIVITGLGVMSPIGNTAEEAWASAKAGKSGIDYIKNINTDGLSVKIGGEVKNFDPIEIFGAREARRLDRVQQLAICASREALEDSGFVVTDENHYDIGCVIGSGIGGITTLADALRGYVERGQRGVSPVAVPQLLHDGVSSRVSMEFGLRGPNYDITTACATGNNTIGDAADMIRLGRAKVMVAGGSEAALQEMVISGFANMKTLAHTDGHPSEASRPFELNRTGFVASEGSAIFILEDLEHALERGAKIYAELVGYGHTSDAYHVTAPLEDGASAAKAMELALREANLTIADIDYINAHGTGTYLNDKSETVAVKRAFGERAYDIPMSSTKSVTGHMLGAAGAIEAVFSVLAIRDNFAPPTINLDVPDPECDLDYVPNVGRELPINHVMSYSAGFGGHNTVLILKNYENGN